MRILLFLIILVSSHHLGLGASGAQLGADLMSLDSMAGHGIGVRGEAGVFIEDDFRLSLGLGYYSRQTNDLSLQCLRLGVGADCFLLEGSGLYAGVNLVDLSYLWDLDAPDDNPILMTQIRLGYLHQTNRHFSFDARLTITDPVLASESDSNYLADCFHQYSKYYISLIASYAFELAKRKEAPRASSEGRDILSQPSLL